MQLSNRIWLGLFSEELVFSPYVNGHKMRSVTIIFVLVL